jgi:putative sigma-54 modulation protein
VNVEYTGRHYEVTPTIRKEVETGLTKLRKILGDKFETKVILTVEKHRHKAEITISPRNGPLVGLAQAKDMSIAVNEALDHLEKQAVKYKTRWQSKKRSARKSEEVKRWNGHSTEDATIVQTAVGLTEKTAVAVVVHRYWPCAP